MSLKEEFKLYFFVILLVSLK